MRGCSSIRRRAQPPMGGSTGCARGAMPCVAVCRSGLACSHPWGGSTGCTTWRHAMRGCMSIRPRVQPPMGWLYGMRTWRHAMRGCMSIRRRVQPPMGWLYGMHTWRHAMRGCSSIRRRVQPPMGWLYGTHIVEPRHAWLYVDPASRAATHGVALRDAHRRATPCVAALGSGAAHQPPMGWLYGIHGVAPRHAWLYVDPASRAATHGVALRESGGVPGSVVRRRQRVAAPGCRVDRARHDGFEAVGLE